MEICLFFQHTKGQKICKIVRVTSNKIANQLIIGIQYDILEKGLIIKLPATIVFVSYNVRLISLLIAGFY